MKILFLKEKFLPASRGRIYLLRLCEELNKRNKYLILYNDNDDFYK